MPVAPGNFFRPPHFHIENHVNERTLISDGRRDHLHDHTLEARAGFMFMAKRNSPELELKSVDFFLFY